MIRQVQVRLTPREAADSRIVRQAACRAARLPVSRLNELRVLRRSIDARGRSPIIEITLVLYTDSDHPEHTPAAEYPRVDSARPIVIVGSGPAGMFAALKAIERGYRPIVLERGKDVHARRRDIKTLCTDHIVDPDSNYCFGEGGAGTYSDGKLYTRSKKRGDTSGILARLVQHGASEEIITDARPHIGTDKLPAVVENIRRTILQSGGSYLFGQCVEDILIRQGRVYGVATRSGDRFEAEAVVLATGHSARDIYRLLHRKGLALQAKGTAIGVRIEHPQDLIDRIQYGPQGRGAFLPAASYRVVAQSGGRGVYSFCMCPGGNIVPSATEPRQVVVNGMSSAARNGRKANSGIVVSVEPQDIPAQYFREEVMGLLHFTGDMEHRAWEAAGRRQTAPAARMTDFCQGRMSDTLNDTTYVPGIVPADLDWVLGDFIAPRLREGLLAFGRKMRGFYTEEATLIGVETRTSSPVRIPRLDTTLSHPQAAGLFPAGEGAGYAGGIVSAAVDGENCAAAAADYLDQKYGKPAL